ncbi:flagellar brake protein [Neiella marina]|uniref:Flagellar brake protein n=1 Tax=Neiella holothuriorum TaxID=2870530 RepID=A0ABS7EJZ1_9GAMM|nr:PilZ domain-containing protein [Neiella holothuriorum]MBW8192666.1 flagellar brake protein [Neiella holothuriorum]
MSIFEQRHITDGDVINEIISYLKPGNLLDFQLNAPVKIRTKLRLIGVESESFFVCALPASAYRTHLEEFNAGHSCVIRAVVGGDLGHCIAFQGNVISVQKSPKPMMFVSWPNKLENFRLRKEQRIGTRIPATLMDKEGTAQERSNYHLIEGTLMDLSVGGCLLQIPWSVQAGAIPIKRGLLKINFPSRPDDPLFVPCEVRRATRQNQENMHVGLQFEPVDELIELFHHINMDNRN